MLLTIPSQLLECTKRSTLQKKYDLCSNEDLPSQSDLFSAGTVAQKFEEWKSKEKFFHRLSNCVKLHMRHHSVTSFKLLSFPRLFNIRIHIINPAILPVSNVSAFASAFCFVIIFPVHWSCVIFICIIRNDWFAE